MFLWIQDFDFAQISPQICPNLIKFDKRRNHDFAKEGLKMEDFVMSFYDVFLVPLFDDVIKMTP